MVSLNVLVSDSLKRKVGKDINIKQAVCCSEVGGGGKHRDRPDHRQSFVPITHHLLV